MRELGVPDYASYYRQVTDGPRGAVEWSTLLDRLTVQETRFFRHGPSFDLLADYLRGRVEQGLAQPLEIWSVGCSSGEEPYSLAMVTAEALGGTAQPDYYGVTGTDISLSALAKAREGLYGARRLEQLEAELAGRYFQVQADGRYKIVPSLAARVCCARLNVLELAKAPMSGMDVIFCQNLLIYFRRWRRREILNRLAERLAPGGLMVLGVGEVVGWQHPDLEPVANEQVLAFTRKG
jgi:type IV pilus assembly protein PilK